MSGDGVKARGQFVKPRKAAALWEVKSAND